MCPNGERIARDRHRAESGKITKVSTTSGRSTRISTESHLRLALHGAVEPIQAARDAVDFYLPMMKNVVGDKLRETLQLFADTGNYLALEDARTKLSSQEKTRRRFGARDERGEEALYRVKRAISRIGRVPPSPADFEWLFGWLHHMLQLATTPKTTNDPAYQAPEPKVVGLGYGSPFWVDIILSATPTGLATVVFGFKRIAKLDLEIRLERTRLREELEEAQHQQKVNRKRREDDERQIDEARDFAPFELQEGTIQDGI